MNILFKTLSIPLEGLLIRILLIRPREQWGQALMWESLCSQGQKYLDIDALFILCTAAVNTEINQCRGHSCVKAQM